MKYGEYPSDLVFQFCLFICFVSLGETEALTAHVKEEEEVGTSHLGRLLQGKAFLHDSQHLVKGNFFPSF